MSAAGPPPRLVAAAALLFCRRPSPAPAQAFPPLACAAVRHRVHSLRRSAPAYVVPVPAPFPSSCLPARRGLSSARPARTAAALGPQVVRDVPDGAAAAAPVNKAPVEMYRGAMRKSVRSLKVFSSSSLVISVASIPIALLADVSWPLAARCGLLAAVVGTSAVSSLVVHWCMSPYVVSIFMTELNLQRLEAHPQPSQLCPPQTLPSSPSPAPDPPILADFRTLKFFGGVRSNIVRTDRLLRSDRVLTNYSVEEAPGRMRYFLIHSEGVYPAGLRKVLGLRDSRNAT